MHMPMGPHSISSVFIRLTLKYQIWHPHHLSRLMAIGLHLSPCLVILLHLHGCMLLESLQSF